MNIENDIPADLSSFVTYRLAQTQNKLNAQATHILKMHSDLTLVEWRVLQLVHLHAGASMTTLAGEVQMDKGQLSRKLSNMIEKGLIASARNPTDSRKQDLHLTPDGRTLLETLFPVMQKRQAMLVKDVSRDDLDVFLRVLANIEEASQTRDIP